MRTKKIEKASPRKKVMPVQADPLVKLEDAYRAGQISDKDYTMWKKVYKNSAAQDKSATPSRRGRKPKA